MVKYDLDGNIKLYKEDIYGTENVEMVKDGFVCGTTYIKKYD